MKEYEKVSKADFESFISNYPHPLTPQSISICQPPFCVWFDKSMPTEHALGSMDYVFDRVVCRADVIHNKPGESYKSEREYNIKSKYKSITLKETDK